jgi:hypothetical protein
MSQIWGILTLQNYLDILVLQNYLLFLCDANIIGHSVVAVLCLLLIQVPGEQ